MTTIKTAEKIIHQLVNIEGVYASLSKFSNSDLATVETYNHVLHIFKDGSIQIHDNMANKLKEYKTVASTIKNLIKLIESK